MSLHFFNTKASFKKKRYIKYEVKAHSFRNPFQGNEVHAKVQAWENSTCQKFYGDGSQIDFRFL